MDHIVLLTFVQKVAREVLAAAEETMVAKVQEVLMEEMVVAAMVEPDKEPLPMLLDLVLIQDLLAVEAL